MLPCQKYGSVMIARDEVRFVKLNKMNVGHVKKPSDRLYVSSRLQKVKRNRR